MKTRTPMIAGTWYPNTAEGIMELVGGGAAAARPLGHPAAVVVHKATAMSDRSL